MRVVLTAKSGGASGGYSAKEEPSSLNGSRAQLGLKPNLQANPLLPVMTRLFDINIRWSRHNVVARHYLWPSHSVMEPFRTGVSRGSVRVLYRGGFGVNSKCINSADKHVYISTLKTSLILGTKIFILKSYLQQPAINLMTNAFIII